MTPSLMVRSIYHPMFSTGGIGAVMEVAYWCTFLLLNLRSQRRPDLEAGSVEAIWVELHVHKRCILFGSICRPPNADTEALDNIAAMLDRVEHKNKELSAGPNGGLKL